MSPIALLAIKLLFVGVVFAIFEWVLRLSHAMGIVIALATLGLIAVALWGVSPLIFLAPFGFVALIGYAITRFIAIPGIVLLVYAWFDDEKT
jgi:hypothetical protein